MVRFHHFYFLLVLSASSKALIIAPEGRYLIRTQSRGPTRCLSAASGTVLRMEPCGRSAQWKFERACCGYYRLRTLNDKCAASNEPRNGPAFVTKCQRASGQLWRLLPARSTIFFTLTSMWRENSAPSECLEGGAEGSPAYMSVCKPYPGQLFLVERIS